MALLLACTTPALGQTFDLPQALNTNATGDSGLDSAPQLATDGKGNWLAAWKSNEDLGNEIGTDFDVLIARSANNGRDWSAPQKLNTNADSDSGADSAPQLATDGKGNWVAVWESNDTLENWIGTDADILFARSTDNGQTWSNPLWLNAAGANDSGADTTPHIATDGTGNWLAVWESSENVGGDIGTDADILVSRSTNNGLNWSPPAALNGNAESDSRADTAARIATDSSGTWVVVWESSENLGGIGTDLDLLFARSTDNGSTWSPPALLNTNAGSDSGWDWNPQLATDGQGNWVAVWYSDENLGGIGTDFDVLVARSTNNGVNWNAPAKLNGNAGSDSGWDWNPHVATDGNGKWVAVWESFEDLGDALGLDWDILVTRSTDNGANWSPPEPLTNHAATDSGHDNRARVAADGIGNWLAAWQSDDPLGTTVGTDIDVLIASDLSVLRYAALGDSFSSGEGTYDYDDNTEIEGGNECHRSPEAYSHLLDIPEITLWHSSAACSGAVTSNVRRGGTAQWNEGSAQLDQVSGQHWDMMTITIGGNDAGFIDTLNFCATHTGCLNDPFPDDPDNRPLRTVLSERIAALGPVLCQTYRDMVVTAPDAAIFVLDYPQIFPPYVSNFCPLNKLGFGFTERRVFRWAIEQVDLKIQAVVNEVGFHYVGVRDRFAQREMCSPWRRDWINDADLYPISEWPFIAAKPESYHPNALGHRKGYAVELQEHIQEDIDLGKPLLPSGLPANPKRMTPACATAAASSATFGAPLPSFGPLLVQAVSPACNERGAYAPGQVLQLAGTGFGSDQPVRLRLVAREHGIPMEFGTITAGAGGAIGALVTVPLDAPSSGPATIEASGLRSDGGALLLIELFGLTSPVGVDSDLDTLPDVCDNCPDTPNTDQLDSDSDGLGDTCDACPDDPANDLDGDGLCAGADPCPFDAENDADGDGVCEIDDNCPLDANPDQADSNTDGRGDACAAKACYSVQLAVSPPDGGGLSITPSNCGSNQYEEGTVVELTAGAADGFTFTGWLGDASGPATPVSVPVNDNLDVMATFRGPCAPDVDGSRSVEVATDIVYIARRLLALDPVPGSFRTLDPYIAGDPVIAAAVDGLGADLDVDVDGTVQVATDIVYIARYLSGLSPVPPSWRLIDPCIPKCIPPDEEISARIDALCP